MAKAKANKNATRKKGKRRGASLPLLGIFTLISAVIFMPTTLLLFFGMLPTVVAAVIDRSGKGVKALSVGALNLAGCTPFLLELWTQGHTVERALVLISDPRAIIVIYSAAAMGYLVDWTVTGIVKSISLQRARRRLVAIQERQQALVERWGREVTGELPLDAYGFPIEGTGGDRAEEATE